MTETASGAASHGGSAGAKGLTLRRIYTCEGVHPYDEVTWERRDVVMTNWRDGSVNFEQHGVEFPDFWSVNAANIVTTKYFRGAIGTPQREWSLKQLVGRVVGAYVAAGREHGYFGTEQDAEIFDHELKHALIHQVFSFNSPVWFNVGTSSPQQVSACQPYYATVSTPAGPVPIGKLVDDNAIGTKVYDAYGSTRIVATKANGVKEVLRVRTTEGHVLDVTPDHLVWRATELHAGEFTVAGFLRPGDHLLYVHPDMGGSDRGLLDVSKIEHLGPMEVYDIQTESGEYLSGNLRVHNCFILAVDDTMDSILEWYREEGLIFKGGSGAGVNLSRIRSSKELLSSGGTASGPVSFMRGADASAGTIKSGGATRRAAKMVVLDVDHPDILEFIETKAREEEKVRVLRDAGFDMDLGGKDIVSVQYQNANNSVRVSDEFMRAVDSGGSFELAARTTGEPIDRLDARELFGKMAKAAWECADPGIQYDSTINDWHTCPESGRITASNPCFPADQRVVTDKGLIRIGDLVARAVAGETFAVYTNDLTSQSDPTGRVVATSPSRYMVTGRNEILELTFSDGSRLRCTPGHRIWTANRGWIHAEELDSDDCVVRSVYYAARSAADRRIPAAALSALGVGRSRKAISVPEKWDAELGQYLGWLAGHGFVTDQDVVTVYRNDQDGNEAMSRHAEFLARIVGSGVRPGVQATGVSELRVSSKPLAAFIRALGFSAGNAPVNRHVPDAIFEAPEEAVIGFLQGLFDADGHVTGSEGYVGVASKSEELLLGVQELLGSLGISGSVCLTALGSGTRYVLRITGRSLREFGARIGFSSSVAEQELRALVGSTGFADTDETVHLLSRESRGYETTYNLTEPRNHSYVVSGVVVANCSEYVHLDNSSCNLASINLLKFLREDDTFDVERFERLTELIIIAMDISICFADFPTAKITETTRAYRQLGIGYANLGALLMATGHAYDSDGGRAIAAAITSLMTGTAYRQSAELAAVVGPYDGYARNAQAHKRVMGKHADASKQIKTLGGMDVVIKAAADKAWTKCLEVGDTNGYRNAQASLLAPTGCLTGETLITTDRGLTRLAEIGDVYGDKWQDIRLTVSTDEGPRLATRFFINGEEPTRSIRTQGGYVLQGTLTHRVKVVNEESGEWEWKRLADVTPGDVVPLQMAALVGSPRTVRLPVLGHAKFPNDRHVGVPDQVTAELAEFVGYFTGNGSLHAEGIRLYVADTDLDVLARLQVLAKELFSLDPVVCEQTGYREISLESVRLARWWQAVGFATQLPVYGREGLSPAPRIPSVILEANDVAIYAAFLRGLFEADGAVVGGVPSISTSHADFAGEVRTVLLSIGLATTTRTTECGCGGPSYQVRLRDAAHAVKFVGVVGFIGARKAQLVASAEPSSDLQLGKALGYLFERVASNEDGGVQPTYDLSVPDNVTYVANGMISHNTIGLMMDCDTTGIEPDLALRKFKKLVGGGSMQIVNQTVPRALKNLGYQSEQAEAIMEYIAEQGHVVDAPGMRQEHYEVFDCAMGERAISPMGHVRMIAAVQPLLSGSVSKTVNMPESATVEDIEKIYFEGWKLGLKALAIYRDNCKVGQPLSVAKTKTAEASAVSAPHEVRPVRRRLPKQRSATVTRFSVAGAEGYMTASTYPDDGIGEVFLKLGKQGSTLAGVMDAFSMAISVGLQYGIPLESYVAKFTNMRFEPAGITDDADIRMSSSVMDYIFRRLALDHLSYEQRADLGILTTEERTAQLNGEDAAPPSDEIDPEELAQSAAVERVQPSRPETTEVSAARPAQTSPTATSTVELIESQEGHGADAPLCLTCGTKMRPAGSCYVCEGCGSTSGCS